MQNSKLKKYISLCIPYLIMLIVIGITFSYQIMHHATIVASDTMIHFQRFYDAMEQIKTGNFSYFQMNYGLYHTGRIFNALYGPFFAYLNGFLLLICGTWFRYEILSFFLIFFVSSVGMYQLSLKVKTNKWVALVLSLIYTESNFVASYQHFNFMAWGGALAPFVIMQAVNMVQDSKRPIHWFQLALIMSILAQVHLWSTAMLTLTIIPFAIYGLIKTTDKKQMIISGLKAVGVTLLLTANVWSAMLWLNHSNNIALPNVYQLKKFAFHWSMTKNFHAAVLVSMIVIILLQLIYVLVHFKKNPFNTLATCEAVILFLISSKYMPWDKIQGRFPGLGASLQFPYRLSVGAWPLIFVAIGITVTQLNEKYGLKSKIITFILLLLVLGQNLTITMQYNKKYVGIYLNDSKVITNGGSYKMPKDRTQFRKILYETNSRKLLDLSLRAQPDYLPVKTSASNKLFEKNILNKLKYYKYKVKGDRLYLYWQSKNTKKRYLPIVMYNQSRLIVNGKDATNVAKNRLYQPYVHSKIGKNSAMLYFVVPIWFWGLLWITILSWVGMLIYGIKLRFNKKVDTNLPTY